MPRLGFPVPWNRQRLQPVACERGVAAVEFALFAPMLAISLVLAADLGLAAYERMTIDHVLRGAAQQALADPGETKVLDALKAAASKNFTVCASAGTANGQFCPTVTTQCICPDGTTPSCTAPVTGCTDTYRKYYTISATKTRENMLIADLSFAAVMKVQAR